MNTRLTHWTRREWLLVAANLPLLAAKPTKLNLACQCYVFEQHYGALKEKTIDHVDDILSTVAGAGFHAVEMTNNYFPPDRSDLMLAALDKYNLALPIAYIGGPMHDDRAAKTHDAALALADRLRGHKGLIGISFNCDPKPKNEPKTDGELVAEAAALDSLGADLKQRGLRLLVHAHAPEMASRAREWRYFFHHTSAANVGICLDTHWVFRGGENVMDILKEAGTRIGDLHLRNSVNGTWLEDLADGDVDYRAVATALKSLKYKGWMAVELAWDPQTPHTRQLGENLRRSREYAEKTFAALG